MLARIQWIKYNINYFGVHFFGYLYTMDSKEISGAKLNIDLMCAGQKNGADIELAWGMKVIF